MADQSGISANWRQQAAARELEQLRSDRRVGDRQRELRKIPERPRSPAGALAAVLPPKPPVRHARRHANRGGDEPTLTTAMIAATHPADETPLATGPSTAEYRPGRRLEASQQRGAAGTIGLSKAPRIGRARALGMLASAGSEPDGDVVHARRTHAKRGVMTGGDHDAG